MRCRAILFALYCCLAMQSYVRAEPRIDWLNPPQGTFSDEWTILSLNNEKVGYANTTMSRDKDTITTRTLTYFKIGRANMDVEISVLQSTRESVEGQPRYFDAITKMAAMEMTTRGEIKEGKVHLKSKQFGVESTETKPFPAGAKMMWGMYRTGIEQGFKPGTTYELEMYEPSLSTAGAVKTKTIVGEPTQIEVLGKSHDVVSVKSILSLPGGQYDTVGFVDPDSGRVLRAEVNLAGFPITMVAAEKADALTAFEPPEFFVNTLVHVDQSIDPDTARVIHYTLRLTGDRRLPDLPTTAMQTPGERTGESAKLVVRRIDVDTIKELPLAEPTGDLQLFLKPSPTLNTDDEEIVKMAKFAAVDETRPYYLADKLRVYVSNVIRDKSLNVGFATASEVCRNKEGDCSEHAVLLAALGRARGLPSRIVVGLAYVPNFAGKKDVFGFHMWTQFNIGGQWIDLDAALRETACSPARIALATSGLDSAGLGDIAFSIMDVISGLEIKIDKIESR